MFNMILKDGTRSDNPMTRFGGEVFKKYDYYGNMYCTFNLYC